MSKFLYLPERPSANYEPYKIVSTGEPTPQSVGTLHQFERPMASAFGDDSFKVDFKTDTEKPHNIIEGVLDSITGIMRFPLNKLKEGLKELSPNEKDKEEYKKPEYETTRRTFQEKMNNYFNSQIIDNFLIKKLGVLPENFKLLPCAQRLKIVAELIGVGLIITVAPVVVGSVAFLVIKSIIEDNQTKDIKYITEK